jgi:hypothetical protein
MQKYIKTYLDHFDLGEQDLCTCECCLKQGRVDGGGFDIHHVNGRGKGKDTVQNLACLCRKHHTDAHNGKISKSELMLIHNNFLVGNRKVFVK